MEVDLGKPLAYSLSHLQEALKELKELQEQHDLLEAQHHDKLHSIDAYFQLCIEPLCSERLLLVSGGAQDEEDKVKGIPKFWLTSMRAVEELSKEITDNDAEALVYLKDIKWSTIADQPRGWKFDFVFESNPYFENLVLTKEVRYTMVRGRQLVVKTKGTEINWRPGKCLTKKTQKSFFIFFMEDKHHAGDVEEHDCVIGFCQLLMKRLVPHAQSIFVEELLFENKLEVKYPSLKQGENELFLYEVELGVLQEKFDVCVSNMDKEIRAAEVFYWRSVKPLHDRRGEIVANFLVDEMSSKDEEEKENLVPAFWLNAMRSEQTLGLMITEHDAKALRYLKDVRFTKSDGVFIIWTVLFDFNPNLYFKNSVLAKELLYDYTEGAIGDVHTSGTEIEWLPGFLPQFESFFNFFKNSKDDGYSMEDLRRDKQICKIILSRIIHHAASLNLDSPVLVPKHVEGAC